MHRPRILVAEPDADLRLQYRLWFQELTPAVEEACDGAEALAKALVQPPDILVAELRMPRIDGAALCAVLRYELPTRNMAVLVCCSDGDAAQASRLRDLGADDVLMKPCGREELTAAVRRLLGRLSERVDLSAGEGGTKGRAALDAAARRRPAASSRTGGGRAPADAVAPPPALFCPGCQRAVEFQYTHVGGVDETCRERWDYYRCRQCGLLQYRHRSGKLRFVRQDHIA